MLRKILLGSARVDLLNVTVELVKLLDHILDSSIIMAGLRQRSIGLKLEPTAADIS